MASRKPSAHLKASERGKGAVAQLALTATLLWLVARDLLLEVDAPVAMPPDETDVPEIAARTPPIDKQPSPAPEKFVEPSRPLIGGMVAIPVFPRPNEAAAPQPVPAPVGRSRLSRRKVLLFGWFAFLFALLFALQPVTWGDSTGSLDFNFTGMLPGQWTTAIITTTNTGAAPEDVYLVFTNANDVWSQVNTLGVYGEIAINGTTYDNLNNRYPENTPGGPREAQACGGVLGAIHYLPHVNFLGAVNPGQSAQNTFSFRYSACMSENSLQGQPAFSHPLEFRIAIFQAGVAPNDPGNGPGMITDLTLPAGYYQ